MTAQGEDILAWLSSAISEREDAALETLDSDAQFAMRRGEEPAPWTLTSEARGEIRDADERATLRVEFASPSVVHHLTVNDPRSVLRRCAADRKAVTLYAQTVAIRDRSAVSIQASQDRGVRPDPCALDDWSRANREAAFMLPLIQILAEGYGWTGGER